jgi:hypothetical protein
MTGTELLEMKKAAGSISSGPLGSKLLAFKNARPPGCVRLALPDNRSISLE